MIYPSQIQHIKEMVIDAKRNCGFIHRKYRKDMHSISSINIYLGDASICHEYAGLIYNSKI